MNEYEDPEMKENPPTEPVFEKVNWCYLIFYCRVVIRIFIQSDTG